MLSQLNLGLQFARLQVPATDNFNDLNIDNFDSDAPPDVITDVSFLSVPAHTALQPLPGYSVLLPELLLALQQSSSADDVQQSAVEVDGEEEVQVDEVVTAAASDDGSSAAAVVRGSVSAAERVYLCVKMEPLGEGASPLTELAVRS
jgi:hypothetical protein